MLGETKIGDGITVGTKRTIKAPNGEKIVAMGIKLVPQGIALGMMVEGKTGRTEYQATLDASSLATLMMAGNYYLSRALGRIKK